MLEYLKEAFTIRPPIRGLGSVPVNILAVIGFLILGVGHPGFWLLGAALETAFLFGLASNRDFQSWVERKRSIESADREDAKTRSLVSQLSPEERKRYADMESKCVAIMGFSLGADSDLALAESDKYALKEALWVYLKLLVARRNLSSMNTGGARDAIRRSIDALERELNDPGLSDRLRQSKAATMAILQKRLRNTDRRDEYLAEVESNLTRIEAQVDLALDRAPMRERPEFIATDIDVAGSLLDDVFFGEAEDTIADLDRNYQARRMVEPSAAPAKDRARAL